MSESPSSPLSAPPAGPAPAPDLIADLRGERCPYTFIKARLAIENLPVGGVLGVILDFPPAWSRVPASFGVLGHQLIFFRTELDGSRLLLFRKAEVPD
ncbi:MAG: hypothetical protein FD180_3026 [Planctomycetota bacterium]|nr:MAG: hypothetical protein FD180_3026 [Planctomycetota bacterium]